MGWPDVLVAAAVVPTAPLLVPALAAGSAATDAVLREQVRAVLGELLAAAPDQVVVVGAAPEAGPVEGTWDWHGFGVPQRGREAAALPHALAMGDWLLDDAGWTGHRSQHGIDEGATLQVCLDIGRHLVDGPARVALLICGGGTACLSEKAPGHLDVRAEEFDRRCAAGLGGADLPALQGLEAELAVALLADGRAPWQVLAGAAAGSGWQAELRHHEAPYGVSYLVASWHRLS